jgi:hypothetical protein
MAQRLNGWATVPSRKKIVAAVLMLAVSFEAHFCSRKNAEAAALTDIFAKRTFFLFGEFQIQLVLHWQ